MGTEEPTAPDSRWDVQAVIECMRTTRLLKRLDSSPNENIEETVVEIDDEWDVRLSTTHSSGEAVCYRVIVEPRGTSERGWTASMRMPPGGVTSSLLRKIPLAWILDVLDQVLAGEREASPRVMSPEGGRVRGPMPLSDDWIGLVAASYVLGCISAPRAPLQAAVNLLGQGYSYSTIREHVQRARDQGFLAPTKRGRAQLELGPRWREVALLIQVCLQAALEEEGGREAEANWLKRVFEIILSASDEQAASELLRQFSKGIRAS